MLNEKTILISGSSGFIGSNLCKKLLLTYEGIRVVGVDNMNDYYDVSLKEDRLRQIEELHKDFTFVRGDISDKAFIDDLFDKYHFDIVVNLAAQAGVRYSIDHPDVYIESNVIGFFNILEAVRNHPVEHLIYASSSSVYGGNTKVPFSTEDKVDHPVSLYAATKKTNELMAYTYTHLFAVKSTGLRFFTVYGPAGRPDMAYFSFTKKLLNGEKIRIFNYGKCERDFTYIDDIVEGIRRIMEKGPKEDYNLYNIGNHHPENLMDFVYTLGDCLKKEGLLSEDFDMDAHMELVEMQPGDVAVTYADTAPLRSDYGFQPNTSLKDGLSSFAKWYKDHYVK
ncbi:MAG: GDP-mannose 4,6-dehydratase [Erysipelotrichaceae bacterium]|nr:GDP-mannose 4,6-dehydratase [Erysipelotrichaceae bacterium]MBQ1775393.1 GDP-mannose 4,6-dehydratase [Erysipelotrichaceae bacterium]MBQ2655064.1 GDP-mannose 4,6-dehydratase [Erysipelotrichaceae bacterium]MBR4610391.1 GDP-mannose 4,6-dehydratase [Erysipelotrichaceae bacterium]MBR6723951.1 GDP-mannose 4,6-dehydratase [Erysipelotrichaceae bacterium]